MYSRFDAADVQLDFTRQPTCRFTAKPLVVKQAGRKRSKGKGGGKDDVKGDGKGDGKGQKGAAKGKVKGQKGVGADGPPKVKAMPRPTTPMPFSQPGPSSSSTPLPPPPPPPPKAMPVQRAPLPPPSSAPPIEVLGSPDQEPAAEPVHAAADLRVPGSTAAAVGDPVPASPEPDQELSPAEPATLGSTAKAAQPSTAKAAQPKLTLHPGGYYVATVSSADQLQEEVNQSFAVAPHPPVRAAHVELPVPADPDDPGVRDPGVHAEGQFSKAAALQGLSDRVFTRPKSSPARRLMEPQGRWGELGPCPPAQWLGGGLAMAWYEVEAQLKLDSARTTKQSCNARTSQRQECKNLSKLHSKNM